MKNCILLIILALVLSCGVCLGAVVKLETQTSAYVTASYSNPSLSWTNGGPTLVTFATDGTFLFYNTDIDFQFTLAQDLSTPGNPEGWFDLVENFEWSVTLYHTATGGVPAAGFSGIMAPPGTKYKGQYYETDSPDGEVGALDGRAWLAVTDYFVHPDVADLMNTEFEWASVGDTSLIGVLADITLDPGYQDFDDYTDDDYLSSNGVTLTFYADETIVPEPATMALLIMGTGTVLRLRRRD